MKLKALNKQMFGVKIDSKLKVLNITKETERKKFDFLSKRKKRCKKQKSKLPDFVQSIYKGAKARVNTGEW